VGIVFTLYDRNGSLRFGFESVAQLFERSDESFHEIAILSSESARIADAVACGSVAACALDFTGKSKCYLVDIESGRIEHVALPRKTRHISFTDDGLLIVTADEFCRFYSLPDMEEKKRVRLGRAVKDVMLCNGRLVVWDGMRGLCLYGMAGETLLEEIERYPVPKCGDIEFIGCDPANSAVTVLHEGSGDTGDTLAVYSLTRDMELRERVRLAMPAPVNVVHMRGTDLVAQLEGGLLIRLDIGVAASSEGVDGSVEGLVYETAFLPVALQALTRTGAELLGIGENGVVIRGSMFEFAPDPETARESWCTLTVLPRPTAD
jgi:hypothetical protein